MKYQALLMTLLLTFACFLKAEGVKDIKPGLWEIQHKTAVDGQALPDMNKVLEQVPPEMRAKVQAAMAKNGAGMTDKGINICITPEQIANQQYGADPKHKCEVTELKNQDNVTHMKMKCSKPKSEGETTITRLSAESWSSVTTMKMEGAGSEHGFSSEATAKWLGADCGDIKPVSEKKTIDTIATDPKAVDPKTIDSKAESK